MIYGEVSRDYVMELLPPTFGSVIDIGSGSGRILSDIRRRNPLAETWAIDPNQDCSGHPGVDSFMKGSYPEDMPERKFDVMVFNDVLEHMVDPWGAVQRAPDFLNPGGVILASIPNVRHYSVVKPLVVGGSFRYQEAGLLDRTHLRFFTISGVQELFSVQGLEIVRCEHRDLTSTGNAARILRVLGRLATPFLARHIVVIARTDQPYLPGERK